MVRARQIMLLIGILLAPISAYAARRVLHVSLYPFIPEAPAAALALQQAFERDHPDVIVQITFNPNYYSTDPALGGVLFEQADVHEIDGIFLQDFIDGHRLAPLSPAFVASTAEQTPIGRAASSPDGVVVAIAHWLCSDFLIYRADHKLLADAQSLAALERGLHDDGLLLDMAGSGAIGELYHSAVMARDGSSSRALGAPDPAIVDRLRRMLALEPAHFGRSLDYDARGGFYARQFSRRAGAAFVGYSEMLHEAFDEAATSCRHEDRCVDAREVRVTGFPFADGVSRPLVWADLFGIDARAHGATLTDAEDFIRFAVSEPGYRLLLIPPPGAPPRYLLPATAAPYADPDILRAAPLYPQFRRIIDRGNTVTAPHLAQTLDRIATRIDADLPAH